MFFSLLPSEANIKLHLHKLYNLQGYSVFLILYMYSVYKENISRLHLLIVSCNVRTVLDVIDGDKVTE